MEPDIALARLAALEQAQLDELEVLLQLAWHRFRDGGAAAQQEVARIPGEASVLHSFESIGALEQRIDRALAAPGLEQLEQRNFRVEQRDQVGGAPLGKAMARRV